MRGNLFAMKAAVFYKNLISSRARNDDSANIDTRNIAFEGHWIAHRPALVGRKLDAHAGQKIEIGMITRHSENKIVLQLHWAVRRFDQHVIIPNFCDRTIEI